MPIVDISLGPGRSPEQIRSLISELTHGTARAIDCPVEAVRVLVREVPTTHWAAGDVTMAETRAARAAAAESSGPAPAG